MAEFLMEVGAGGSYLDAASLRRSGTGAALWALLARGLLIPYSCEGKVFASNLSQSLERYREAQEHRRKLELAGKRRMAAIAMAN